MEFRTVLLGLAAVALLAVTAGGAFWAQPGPASATGVAVSENDDFADGWVVSSLPFVGKQNTSGMTTEAGEPTSPPPMCAGPLSWGATVWYRYTASASGVVLAGDTAGSDFTTVLAAYTGTAVNDLTLKACDSVFGGDPVQISFPVVAGETYHFQIGGWTVLVPPAGNLSLSLSIQPTPTPCPTGGCPTATPATAAAEVSLNAEGPDVACDRPDKPSKCFVDPGSEFTVSIVANRIPAGGYGGFQTLIDYGSLKYKPTTDLADEIVWPDGVNFFRVPESPTGQEGSVGHASLTVFFLPLPVSGHIGNIVQIALTCSATIETFKIELIPLSVTPLGTAFINPDGSTTVPDVGGPLQISCIPTPSPTQTETPIPPTFTPTAKSTPTPRATPTLNPLANGSMRIDADCDDPTGPPKDSTVETKRYVLVGDTFQVCVFGAFPAAVTGYQFRVEWDEEDFDLAALGKEVWGDQPELVGGPINRPPNTEQEVGEGYIRMRAEDAGVPPKAANVQYQGPVAQLQFVCQKHGAAIIDLRLPGASDGSVFLGAGGSQLKPALAPAVVFCLEPTFDSDLDGCTSGAELGANEYLGGQRNPLYFWDFYDVWTHPVGQPTVWVRDDVVTVPGDIIGVARRFGPGTVLSEEEAFRQALIPPTDETGYHPAFDRGLVIGANHWVRAPADGAINISDDVLGVAQQFGHNCA